MPYVRGREHSRSAEDIVSEIQKINFVDRKQLVFAAHSSGAYAGTFAGKKISFASLLEIILRECPQIPSLLIPDIHPKDVTDELIEVIAREQKIQRGIDFPVQSGNDRILRLMNRGYTAEQYRVLVQKIHERIPDMRIITDIIVGFPSETEEEFLDSCNLVKELPLSKVCITIFSPRAGTKASGLQRLPQDITYDRQTRLIAVLNNILGMSYAKN
jgi:tRNA-2-methylthio-N6-dimethylallyladenosine synthase